MSVPTNLIPTKVTGLPEYTGSGTYGYMPYVIDGRTYKVQFSNIAAVGAVPSSRTIATGTGLTGGGDLSQDRTISIAPEGVSFDQLAPSGVVAGVYGSGTAIPVVTVDAKGRVTSATTTPLSISGYVPTSRSVFAGTGLTGGGDLASDVTLAVNFSDNNPQALGTATAGVSTAAARGDHVHPAVDLSDTSQTQGALPLGRGGTGDALSPVAGAVVYSTGTKFALTNPGIAGQVLMSNGVDEPLWATVTGIGTVTSVNASGGTTGLTFTGGPVTTAGTLTLGGTLAVTNGGTGATNAATARSNLGAAASGANSDITSMSGITGAIATPDYIDFDTAATVTRATGRLWWDNADGNQTLSLGMAGGNATLQIGEEMYFRIKASSAITEGQAVMFTGTLGASGGLTGAPATGLTKDTASYLMGVATEDIPLNSWGYVTQFGLVRSFNTTGGAEAWVDGQILYYNPAVPGGLTKTVPTAPAAKIEVAAVVHAASNGSVFVRPTARFSLTQLNDVETSAASDLDLLQYNGTSGVWQHKSPSLISVGSATNLAGGAANRIAYQTGAGATGFVVAPTVANTYLEWSGSAFQWSANPLGTVTSVNASGGTTGLTFSGGPVTTAGTLTLGGTLGVANGGTGATSLTSGYLLKGNGTSAVSASVVYDDGTNVGIGTASPGYKLDVAGQSRVYNTPASFAQLQSLTQYTGSAAPVGLGQGSDATGYLINLANAGMAFGTNGSEHMRIDATGNVGIGATSITGIFGRTLQIANGSTEGSLSIVGSTGSGFVATSGSVFAVTARGGMALTLGTNDTEKVRITSAGYVGVGVTPSASTEPLLQMQNGGMIATAGPYAHFMANAFYGSGGWTYTTTGTASRYEQAIGTHKWYVAASGTAGNPITFTQAMALDGAGNVALTKLAFNIDSPFYTGGNITAGANALGIGTTGAAQVGFFTNNSERMRITSAGFVGIGTSSPSSKLTVLDGDIEVNATGLGNTLLSFNGTTANLTVNSSSAPLIFGTNSTERMRIDSSGNVGIGTSSPGVKLDVVGGIRGQALDATGTPALFSTSGGSVLYYNGAGVGVVRAYSNSGGAAGALTFNASGAEDARVDSSGNFLVGITGQIYPTANRKTIEVNGTSQSLFGMGVGGTGAAYILHDGTNMDIWQSRNGYMRFGTNGSERMRIDASGNVGIGTTAPASKLHVSGSYITAGSVSSTGGSKILAGEYSNAEHITTFGSDYSSGGPVLGYGVWPSTSASGAFVSSAAINIQRSAYLISGQTHIWYNGAAQNIAVGSAVTVTERMRLDASGNFGVGRVSPDARLSVDSGSLDVVATFNSTGNTYIQLQRSGIGHVYLQATAGAAYLWNQQNTPFLFGTNNTEQMRLTSSGQLFVGTNSISTKFAVVGYDATYNNTATFGSGLASQYLDILCGFALTNGTPGGVAENATMTFRSSGSSAGNLAFATGNTEQMRIDANGLVGINVTPSARFHVKATTSLTAILDSSANTYLQFRQSGTNTFYIQSASTYMAFWNIQNTPMIFANNGSEKMRLDASGSLGIGTTPSAALGGGTVTLDVLSSTNGEAMFRSSGDVSTGAAMQVFIGGSNNIRSAYIGYGGINNVFDVWNSLAGAMTFGTSNSERMRIASGGNVGIGTSSPNAAARLDVSSTTSGFLPPRMTTTQRDAISSPPDGLILYNSTTSKLQVRAGGAWVDLH